MASTKKRAIYVRGPDNIYRRQNVDPATSSESVNTVDMANKKAQVDSTLNDLMECSFRLQDTAALSLAYSTEHTTDLADLISPSTASLPSYAAHGVYSKSESGNSSSAQNHSVPSRIYSFFESKIPSAFNTLARMLHDRPWLELLVPYFLGMLTTYLFLNNQEVIASYLTVLSGLLRMALLWSFFTASVCWYFGAINISHMSDLKDWLQGIKDHLSSGLQIQEPSPEPHDSASMNSTDDVSSMALSEIPRKPVKPSRAQIQEDRTSGHPITNVRPYVPRKETLNARPRRPISSNDTKKHDVSKPELNKYYSDPDALRKRTPRSRLPEKLLAHNSRRHSSASLELQRKTPPKQLPIIHNKIEDVEQELPLVHEVRLRDNYDIPPNLTQMKLSGLERLGSVMSKQSVLGTRANYNKFLSNVRDS